MAISIYISINSIRGFPFFPQTLQHLLFVDFFDDGHSDQCEVIVAILVGMKYKLYFIAVLTYTSLMANDAKHHFMYLFNHSL